MIDIKRFLIKKIFDDPQASKVLGVSPTDTRMYPFYNPNAKVDPTHQAFITYRLMSQGEAGGRIKQPVFRLQLWAASDVVLEVMKDHIMRLLDKKKFQTDTNRVIYIKQVSESDVAPEATSSTNLPGKAIDLRVGFEDKGV